MASGSMGAQPMKAGTGFIPPTATGFGAAPGAPMSYSYDDEPPLLEELGINFEHIMGRTIAVMNPFKSIEGQLLEDADLAGPLLFCLVLGFCLLFSGKIHFGYIFGLALIGCTALYMVLNLLSQRSSIDLFSVVSVVGYALLPIVALSVLTIVVNLRGVVGLILSALTILWCTYTATRFFQAILSTPEQRYLMAYPVFLFYACFALITIF